MKMKKTIKASALVFFGLLIFTALSYMAFAFVKAEWNPFLWSEGARSGLVFSVFCYVAFSPLMILALKEESE